MATAKKSAESEPVDDSAEVVVSFGDNPSETATLLLAAAEDLGREPGVVRTGEGVFYVTADLAKKAGVKAKEE